MSRVSQIKKAIKRVEVKNADLFKRYKKANSETEFRLYCEIGKNTEIVKELKTLLEIELLLSEV